MTRRYRAVPVESYHGDRDVLTYCGAQLRAGRKAKGLSVKALAAQVGLSDSAVSALELGQQWVRMPKLLHLAEVLELDVVALFPPRTGRTPLEHLVLVFRLLPAEIQAHLAAFVLDAARIAGVRVPVEGAPPLPEKTVALSC